jgi:formate hydrogenlyase transcriptional activator
MDMHRAYSSEALAEQYQALLEVSESIAAHHDLAELFRDLAQRLPRVIKFTSIVLGLHDSQKNVMRLHILEDPRPGLPTPGLEYPVEDVPGGWVWQHQTPLVCANIEEETRFPKVMPMIRMAGTRSFCIVPLTTARRRLGALGFGSVTENQYDSASLDFIQQVGKQVAVAVENALNFERACQAEQEATRRFERERLMLEINNAVVSQLNLRELVRVISSCLSEALDINAVGLSLYEPETACFRVYYYDLPDTIPSMEAGATIPAEGSIGGLALKLGRPILINRPSEASAFPESKSRFYDHGFNSGGCVPLIMQGRKLGVLGVLSFREDAFPEARQQLLCQIADQIAIATENALNFERALKAEQALMRQLDHERLMLEINNAVVSHLNLGELLKSISACLRRVMPHDLSGFCVYDSATDQLRGHSLDFPSNQEFGGIGDPIPLEGTPEGLAFMSQKTVLIKNLNLAEFPAEIIRRGVAAGLKSGCAVPLISHGKALGTLSIVSLRENAFSEDDAELLGNIGSQLAIAVENVLAYQEIADLKDKLNKEKLYLEDEIRTEYNFGEIVGESPLLKRMLKQVEIVAPTDSTVLILGETGTGKELLARAIHNRSNRRERTFVKMNCAAIPTGLLESELFGHERGAFTGAIATKVGRFELADGGTLFLDEVGDIPLELQSKLLRVLQEQEFERLGSTRTIRINVRLVAATNRDLTQMVEEREFRSDLYYRLNVFPLTVPALRDRREDIPLLVRYFVQQFARRMDKKIETIPSETMTILSRYDWPGNVRELENLTQRAVILSQTSVLHVPLAEMKARAGDRMPSAATLEETEREHILKILKATRWVIGGPSGAAAQLGMKRTTLQSKMQRLSIVRPT